MKEEAIHIFKLLSKLEYDYGFISLNDYRLRLVTLFHLADNSKEIENYIFQIFGDVNLSETSYNVEGNTNLSDIELSDEDNSENENPESSNPLLHFTTSQAGAISKLKWKFTIGDPDYFPSIPHGHATKNKKVKLDSYLGYFYNVSVPNTKANSIGRESRQYIIDLWNNDNFRTFAVNHIDWYLMNFSHYNWRVPKSRIKIIPRKR